MVTGLGPQSNVMMPPSATAVTTAADVQPAGVPSPITWSGSLVLTASPAAGTVAFPLGLPPSGPALADPALADADAELPLFAPPLPFAVELPLPAAVPAVTKTAWPSGPSAAGPEPAGLVLAGPRFAGPVPCGAGAPPVPAQAAAASTTPAVASLAQTRPNRLISRIPGHGRPGRVPCAYP
jgi:hypothetical protein